MWSVARRNVRGAAPPPIPVGSGGNGGCAGLTCTTPYTVSVAPPSAGNWRGVAPDHALGVLEIQVVELVAPVLHGLVRLVRHVRLARRRLLRGAGRCGPDTGDGEHRRQRG